MKKFILIIFISLFLMGCTKEEKLQENIEPNQNSNYSETNTNNSENTNNNENNIPNDSTNTEDNKTNNDNMSNNNTISNNTENVQTANNNEIIYSSNDKTVISTIETIDKEVDDFLEEPETESVKDKAKGIFITLVDFLFYDGEIKGITFNELTENGKAKVLQLVNAIDEKIEKHFPGYKDTISSKTKNAFAKASEVIKKGANNVKDFTKEALGEEYYQDIINAKDDFVYYTKNALDIVGDISSSLFNSLKDKLSSWYEDFKNS